MTSKRKIKANRRNAARSTGPGTRDGKARASHNAYRHGLAVSVLNDPAISPEVERLARAIVGKRSDPHELLQARIIAEAEVDLLRVRMTRAKMIDLAAENLNASTDTKDPGSRAFARSQGTSPPTPPLCSGVEIGPHALLRALPELETLERYERRAFSRRRRAIRQCTLQVCDQSDDRPNMT
jgi:hypothetical protein